MVETDVRNKPQQTGLYWQDRHSPFSRATFPNYTTRIPSLKALDFPQSFSITSLDRENLPSHVSCQRQHLPMKGSTHKNHASPLRAGISTSFPFRCRPSEVIWTKQRCGQIGQDQGLSWEKERCIVFLFSVCQHFMVGSAHIHIIMPRFYLSPWLPFPHIRWSRPSPI